MSREMVQSSVPRLSCFSNFADFSAHPCRPSSSSQTNAGPLIDHVAQGGVGVAHKHTQQPERCEACHAGCLTAVMMRILKRICVRVCSLTILRVSMHTDSFFFFLTKWLSYSLRVQLVASLCEWQFDDLTVTTERKKCTWNLRGIRDEKQWQIKKRQQKEKHKQNSLRKTIRYSWKPWIILSGGAPRQNIYVGSHFIQCRQDTADGSFIVFCPETHKPTSRLLLM